MSKTCFLLILITVSISCSSPKKSFQKKQYEKALNLAVKAIEKDKNIRENKQILKRSLTKIDRQHNADISLLLAKANSEDSEKAYRKLESLVNYYDSALPYLESSFLRAKVDLEAQKADLGKQLGLEFYHMGKELLELAISQETKSAAQDAYYTFIKASKYQSELDQIDSLMELSIIKGRYTYIVNANSYFEIMYNWNIDRTFENIANQGNQFIRIIYDPITNPTNTDCSIMARFKNLNFDTNKSNSDQQFVQRVIVEYKQVIDTSGNSSQVPVYGDVSATVTTTTITKKAIWNLEVNIENLSKNCNLNSNYFTEWAESKAVNITTFGDSRALPSQYQQAQFSEELDTDDEMTQRLIQQLYDRFRSSYF